LPSLKVTLELLLMPNYDASGLAEKNENLLLNADSFWLGYRKTYSLLISNLAGVWSLHLNFDFYDSFSLKLE
jgi:hypothetical protein